jgi:DNA topoisomerase-1
LQRSALASSIWIISIFPSYWDVANRSLTRVAIVQDPAKSAQIVGLRYVSDEMPGIRRKKAGKVFRYVDAAGKVIRDARQRERIKSLAIPPAWEDVWICPVENGHLQATGRDDRGRKQHLYHSRWREVRDETKFNRMIAFAKALPRIRRRIQKDMALPGLSRDKVLATVVRLLEVSLIRVGNEEYARDNRSFGLTTMRTNHVKVSGTNLRFQFRGKSGKHHTVDVNDRRLARIVKNCQAIPGQDLFQYLDEEENGQGVDSGDVNEYVREISGEEFTAKDFRTWAGTVLTAQALREFDRFESETQAKQNIVEAVKTAAKRLGNTPVICRKCYVHPAILDAYLDGTLAQTLKPRGEGEPVQARRKLQPEEAAVLGLLRQRLPTERRRRSRRV